MASDDLWILGIHMTKFGKHPDLDLVDLAAEAVSGALADGGVTMKDMGVIGAGNLMAPTPASANSSKSNSARPAFPFTTWPTPVPPGPPRSESPPWRSRPASATWGSPLGSRSSLAPDCFRAGAEKTTHRRGRRRVATGLWPRSTGASGPRSCRASSPRSAWNTAISTAAPASSCSPKSARRTTPTRRSIHWRPTPRRCRSKRSWATS